MDGSDFFTSCACLSPSATIFTVRRHQHTTYKQSISTVNLFFSFFFLLACFRFLFFLFISLQVTWNFVFLVFMFCFCFFTSTTSQLLEYQKKKRDPSSHRWIHHSCLQVFPSDTFSVRTSARASSVGAFLSSSFCVNVSFRLHISRTIKNMNFMPFIN